MNHPGIPPYQGAPQSAPGGGPPGYNPPANYPAGPGPGGFGSVRASFGQRLVALLVDGVVISIVGMIVAVPFFAVGAMTFETEPGICNGLDGEFGTPCDQPTDATIMMIFVLIGLFLLAMLVVTYLMHIRPVSRSGQTIGRRMTGIKVVNINDGSLLSGGQALGRYLFANFISANIMYIGYLWMLWDDQQQTLHDKVTNATVIRV